MLKRSNLSDLYLANALPFLEAVVEEKYDEYDSVVEKIFNVKDMQNGISQTTQVSGLSSAGEVGEGEEIRQDRVYQGFSKTYLARKFGIMMAISQESIDDQKYDSISKNAAKLGRAVRMALEIDGINVFNNAFSTAGLDGKTLCATDHPLLAPGAGACSNRLAVDSDLSTTTMKDMITLFKKQLDTAGNKIQIRPETLLVPSELEYLAFEILRSTYLPGGSDNSISSIGPNGLFKIQPMCSEFLTDNDAWFLIGSKADHELKQYWAKRPTIGQEMDFKTDVALMRIIARWDVGYSDWRAVCGTPGA